MCWRLGCLFLYHFHVVEAYVIVGFVSVRGRDGGRRGGPRFLW